MVATQNLSSTDTASYVDLEDISGDGTLVIYKRAGSKRGVYQARISLVDQTGYVIRSTGCRKKNDAIARAKTLEQEAMVRAAQNLNHTIGEFKDVYLKWIEHLKSTQGKSELRIHQHEREAERYFFHFFEGMPFEKITERQVDRYWDYRISYWTSKRGMRERRAAAKQIANRKNRKKLTTRQKTISKLSNVSENPSPKSIRMEAGTLREFWRWSVARGFAPRMLDITIRMKKREADKREHARRGHFDEKEWMDLIRYMRTWVRAKGINKMNRHYRQMLRDLVIFLGNTGLRVGEARELKWAHIREEESTDGKVVGVRIEVPHNTKTGERVVMGRSSARDVLMRRRKESPFTKKSDYVFANYRGERFGNCGVTFNSILNATNLKTDKDGLSRSLYSCRHTYITFRMKSGRHSIDEVAKNTGTSVSNISKIYSHKTVEDAKDAFFS